MAVSREQLIFDTFANTSRAEAGFQALGRKAGAASDDVMGLARRLDEISKKSADARVSLQGDKEALARLDKLDLKMAVTGNKVMSPKVSVEGAARASAEITALDVELDHLSEKSTEARVATTGLAGIGARTGGLGALIGAGVVLSPVLVTLAAGAAAFGTAAYGVAKPIENAAQKAGGLAKNLSTLDAEQQVVARGILGLGREYSVFQAALKPTVLHDFNDGLQLAGHLLHDVQPVAVSFGKALGGFIGQLDKMFASGEWQGFFQFMARTAGPDLQMTGKLFIDLADDLPPLLVALQPVASALLKTADALALTGRAAEQLSGGPLNALENFNKAGQSAKDSSTGVSAFDAALITLVGPQRAHSADNFFHSLNEGFKILTGAEKGAAQSTQDASAQWSHATKAVQGLTYQTVTTAVATDHMGKAAAATSFQVARYGAGLDLAAAHGDHMGKTTDVVVRQMYNAGAAALYDSKVYAQVAHELNVLAAAQVHALTPLENYIGASLNEANQLHQVNIALRASGDRIGYKTQKERDSFGALQTYIGYTIKQGNAALGAHRGIDAQISSIEHALPRLEAVKGKTAAYRDELGLLKGILDKLRAEKLIQEKVNVTGTGHWAVVGTGPFAGKITGAQGAFVRQGTTPTADDVVARVSKGELIVPAKMVTAGLVDHLRGAIPGFAAGGIVPSYGGPVAGLPPWTSHNQHATVTAISVGIAKAMAAAFKSAVTAASTGFGRAGPGGGAPAANAALARRMMPSWGSGAEWAAWNYVAMRESGWNQFARNPSSGAYGIPQALPPSKMGAAANPPQSNPHAQISWMIGYIRGRYHDPIGAAAHERAFNWYGSGGSEIFTHPTVIGVGERGPERVDVTPVGSRSAHGGPLVHIDNFNSYDATDPVLLGQRLSFAVVTASLGS